jgi:hypothetical protein
MGGWWAMTLARYEVPSINRTGRVPTRSFGHSRSRDALNTLPSVVSLDMSLLSRALWLEGEFERLARSFLRANLLPALSFPLCFFTLLGRLDLEGRLLFLEFGLPPRGLLCIAGGLRLVVRKNGM